VNIDILGISEVKWTGMGKFNSDDHYIYYCGQESLRRNGDNHKIFWDIHPSASPRGKNEVSETQR